jgi:hypothetical protein
VKDRALPRVGDGQKPVQGRILTRCGSQHPRRHQAHKSAAVVGDVLGKLHPHGDQSVYDALVRLAQDFTMRYPLIDGEGNFGSRDGDEAAAYRYTEARLTRIAEVLLAELDQGTVDFAPNYDGTREEPTVLPARLPMVLLNGASGIAVGMATEIPSHNLNEVANAAIAMIRDPEISIAGLMKQIKGRTFPGGAQIITPRAELKEAYTTGRGSVRVRARWNIERLARGQWQLVVHELPPGTSAKKVLEEIEAITNPQPRPGKKSLTPEQTREKQLMLAMLDKARDESDRAHPVRLVFEPRTSKIDETEFVNLLLAKTGLEGNVAINLVMVGLDGRPTGKNLREVIAEWIKFRFTTVTAAPGTGWRSARPHPRPRRPDDRPAERGQGDQDRPQGRRSEGRIDQGVQVVRTPGRRHPRNPPAATGETRANQDRAGAQGPAEGTEGPGEDPQGPQGAGRPGGHRDRGRRQDLRRQAPHPHRGIREGSDRNPDHRRAGYRDLFDERLGTRARAGSDPATLSFKEGDTCWR